MKVEDDLKLHSHCIAEIDARQDKFEEDTMRNIELLRTRTHALKEEVGILTHSISDQAKSLLEMSQNQKDIAKNNKEIMALMQPIDVIRKILCSGKTYLLLISLVFTGEMTASVSEFLKHLVKTYNG
jgi:hypothetical protein